MTFELVTWKSIRIIYLLKATPVLSSVLIKWRCQKIFDKGQRLVHRPIDRPTDRPTIAKQYAPFLKGGIIKYEVNFTYIGVNQFVFKTDQKKRFGLFDVFYFDMHWKQITFMITIFVSETPGGLCSAHKNFIRRVFPHPVSPITMTGMLHLQTYLSR